MKSGERLCLKYPVVTEGKYDKIKLSGIISSPVITFNGFCIFNDEQKKNLLKEITKSEKIIVLTDSDNAGNMIRARIKDFIKSEKIINLYIPQIEGKEKRKSEPSKEGFLGVEGMKEEILYDLLLPFSTENHESVSNEIPVTNADFYKDGLSGKENSSALRKALAKLLCLPDNLTAKALIEAVNLTAKRSGYERAVKLLNGENNTDGKS